MAIRCPRCDYQVTEPTAELCPECSYRLPAHPDRPAAPAPRPEPLPVAPPAPPLGPNAQAIANQRTVEEIPARSVLGWFFLLLGLFAVFYFITGFDNSVPSGGEFSTSRVINQGLLATQSYGVMCGLTLWLSGLLCILIPAGSKKA